MAPAAIQDPFLQRLVRKDTMTAKKVAQKVKELMKVHLGFHFLPLAPQVPVFGQALLLGHTVRTLMVQ